MGTALAMHLARKGRPTALWASPFDAAVLPALTKERKHPGLPEHLPESLAVLGPDDLAAAAKDLETAVMGANSTGARTLARLVVEGCGAPAKLVSVAKGLEPETYLRMSEVYASEAGHAHVVSVGGPCLAPEVAQGLPSSVVFASSDTVDAEAAAAVFRSRDFHVAVTDDVVGVEYCTVAKNVAAIGVGIVDGLAKVTGMEYRNAKSALFSQAFLELERLVVSLGGRIETARGLAGLADVLVTSLGGRNRLYGELVGAGGHPDDVLADLGRRGMTVEGVDSSRDVRRLADEQGLDLPYHFAVERVVFEAADPDCILEVLL